MKNAYGNYVVQKSLKVAKSENKKILIDALTRNIDKLCDKKLISKWKIIINNSLGNFASLCGPNTNSGYNTYSNSFNNNYNNKSISNVSNNVNVNNNGSNNTNNINVSFSSNSSMHSTQFSSPQIATEHLFMSNGRLAKSLHGSPLIPFYNMNNMYYTPSLKPVNKYS